MMANMSNSTALVRLTRKHQPHLITERHATGQGCWAWINSSNLPDAESSHLAGVALVIVRGILPI